MNDLYTIKKVFKQHITLVQQVAVSNILEQIAESAVIIKNSLKNGKKVLFCGNGGSAADSQHLAAEFVGRFQKERVGLPAIALTVDTSILTAVANDYGYDTVFARQVQALGNDGDVLVGLSTSGNSKNVLAAIDVAKAKGMQCIGLTAQGGRQNGRGLRYLYGCARSGNGQGTGDTYFDRSYFVRISGWRIN